MSLNSGRIIEEKAKGRGRDGIVVVEYLGRTHGVGVKVRQAQRWIRRLGFSLRQPIHRYAQATTEGVEEF